MRICHCVLREGSFQQTGCKKKSIIVIFLKKNELYEKKPMQVRVLGPDKGYRFYIKVTCMKSEVANLLSLNNVFD